MNKSQSVSAQQFQAALVRESHDPLVKFIDVRTPQEYKQAHIEGVENVPLSDLAARQLEFKNTQRIYVHCGTGKRSGQAAKKLHHLEGEIFDFCGGLEEWRKEGYGLVESQVRISLMRQVLITAGALVLIGLGMYAVGVEAGLFLSAFVGAGLLFAGITGWCGMALMLGKMPWNQ